MTTWRDIASELTADQIADLELMEQNGFAKDRLLTEARSYATVNLRGAVELGHVAWPFGAEVCREWCKVDGRWMRDFTGGARHVGNCQVFVLGEQLEDGTVKQRRVVVKFDGGGERELTSAEACELASALLATADEAGPTS